MKYIYFVTIYNNALNGLIESPLHYNDNYRNCLSEPLWFYSLYISLLNLGYHPNDIIINENSKDLEEIIKKSHISDIKNSIFFMDFVTIPHNCDFINKFEIKNNVYDLHYWGDDNKERFKITDFPLTHVLTPWDYKQKNTFLGFNSDLLFPKNNSKPQYENYGFILLKSKLPLEETIFKNKNNKKILEHLNDLNVKIYACSTIDIPYDNIINLGLLSRSKWLNLVKSSKFYLAFDCSPILETSILEIHHNNIPIISPINTVYRSGIENSINYYNTNNLSNEEIAILCNNISWKNENEGLSKHCNSEFNKRLLNLNIKKKNINNLSQEERFNYYIKNWKEPQTIIIPEEVKKFTFNEVYYYQGPHITKVDNFKYEYGVLTPGFWWAPQSVGCLDFPCISISSDGVNNKGLPALSKNRYINDPLGSILCPLEWVYMWNTNILQKEELKNSVKWEDKINDVLWRGSPTGNQDDTNERVAFCKKWGVELGFNVGISCTWDKWDPIYLKPKMTIPEMLKYKYQVSIEGNCYATDLKWKLASNSVVLMRKPKIETWAMEGLLIPWVHYVPLANDYSDFDIIVEWCKNNDEKCQEIVKNANNFMKQFENIEVEIKIFNMIKTYYKKTFTFIYEESAEKMKNLEKKKSKKNIIFYYLLLFYIFLKIVKK